MKLFKALKLLSEIEGLEQKKAELEADIKRIAENADKLITLHKFRNQLNLMYIKGFRTDIMECHCTPKEHQDFIHCVESLCREITIVQKGRCKGRCKGKLTIDGIPLIIKKNISRFFIKVRRTKNEK